MRYNEHGEELPDDTPVELPLKFKRPPTMQEMIKEYVRGALSDRAAEQGLETFEEANDFGDEDDEDMPLSHSEVQYMVDEDVVSHVERERLDKRRKEEENKRTVNKDRIKEKEDVHVRGAEVDSKGVDRKSEERSASGSERRSAGERGGGVSEGAG